MDFASLTATPTGAPDTPPAGGSPPPASTAAAPSPYPTPTRKTDACPPALFNLLPRMDLIGKLIGSAAAPGDRFRVDSEDGCRRSCCATPGCDAYTVEPDAYPLPICFLYTNVTALAYSSVLHSGVLHSVYS